MLCPLPSSPPLPSIHRYHLVRLSRIRKLQLSYCLMYLLGYESFSEPSEASHPVRGSLLTWRPCNVCPYFWFASSPSSLNPSRSSQRHNKNSAKECSKFSKRVHHIVYIAPITQCYPLSALNFIATPSYFGISSTLQRPQRSRAMYACIKKDQTATFI